MKTTFLFSIVSFCLVGFTGFAASEALAKTAKGPFPAVTYSVKSAGLSDGEFCVVQIGQPELSGYSVDYWDYGHTHVSDTTLLRALSTLVENTRFADNGIKKSLTIPFVYRTNDNLTHRAQRVLSVTITPTANPADDNSILRIDQLVDLSTPFDDLVIDFATSTAAGVANSLIVKWNSAVQTYQSSKNAKKQIRAAETTETTITQALTFAGNAEAVLLARFGCEDKKGKIAKENVTAYLSSMLKTVQMLNFSSAQR